MEHMQSEEFADIARLVEVTSDAVAVCDADGTVLHVNRQLLGLTTSTRGRIVGMDVKDLLYSAAFERAGGHRLPFSTDGGENTLMIKLHDGSFIPVRVRAVKIGAVVRCDGTTRPERLVVAIRSLEEQYAHDRKTQRLLSELKAANKRLSGTLSVIMSTVGSSDMPSLLDTVLNRMTDTLDAAGATIYFAEGGGFKLRGVSRALEERYVPDFMPYGTGVPTYVLRAQHACRLSIVPPEGASSESGSLYDLDERTTANLSIQDMPPFKTLIAVPVYFGTQVLGVVELGWMRPCTPRMYDVRVLEVICDYLSIELVGMVASLRSARTSELTRSLNRVRDLLFSAADDRRSIWGDVAAEIREMLACRVLTVEHDAERDVHVVDFEGGSRIDLPSDIDELFFSCTAPAVRVGPAARGDFMRSDVDPFDGTDEPRSTRLARIERASDIGSWLESNGLPCQGVFIDLGSAAEGALSPAEDEGRGRYMFLLLRDATQEPIDDMEFDYLTHLARDFELIELGSRRADPEHRIAQTLQAGMRSSLGSIPGITADSLYSSATKQALVGGDFYTLIRLPDDRAVMMLGDVSGKGIEAASMSALVKTALSAYAWEGASPARMARSLNRMLMSFSRVETFVTAFIAKIDLRHRRVTYCSAGHPPTMLMRSDAMGGVECEQLSVQSGVIGAFSSMAYENGAFSFDAGDVLFMYTDGAIEARDAAGEFFGEDRLRQVLMDAVPAGVDGLCQKVLGELDRFSGSALDDDIALAALRLDGISGDAGC